MVKEEVIQLEGSSDVLQLDNEAFKLLSRPNSIAGLPSILPPILPPPIWRGGWVHGGRVADGCLDPAINKKLQR